MPAQAVMALTGLHHASSRSCNCTEYDCPRQQPQGSNWMHPAVQLRECPTCPHRGPSTKRSGSQRHALQLSIRHADVANVFTYIGLQSSSMTWVCLA